MKFWWDEENVSERNRERERETKREGKRLYRLENSIINTIVYFSFSERNSDLKVILMCISQEDKYEYLPYKFRKWSIVHKGCVEVSKCGHLQSPSSNERKRNI